MFSESTTVTGTATAKGNFNITMECTSGQTVGTATGTCKVTDNKVTTTSNFKKPTDAYVNMVTITNSGTIPAVLKTVDSSNNKNNEWKVAGDERYLNEYYLVAMYQLEEYESDSSLEAAKIELQPGESISLIITHAWGDSVGIDNGVQKEVPEAGASMSYNITLGFEQLTTN